MSDPLDLASLRNSAVAARAHEGLNPLVLHRRIPNKQRAQVLASSPFESAEIKRDRDQLHTAAAPKPLMYLRKLVHHGSPEKDVLTNIISQLGSAMGELQPKHISEILKICVMLRYTPEPNVISALVSGLLKRPDCLSLADSILSLRNLEMHAVADILAPVFSQSINGIDRPDKVEFATIRSILITATRESATLDMLDDFSIILNREIPTILDPRQLLFLPRALLLFSDSNQKLLLPNLLARLDGLVTARLPVTGADALECLFGLEELNVDCSRWRMFTEVAVSRSERGEVLAECKRRGFPALLGCTGFCFIYAKWHDTRVGSIR